MNFEHVALNVSEPVAMAKWYEEHLGLEIVNALDETPYTRFLRDSDGNMMLEIYSNPPEMVPNYADMDPLILHIAFESENPREDGEELLKAGAALVSEKETEDGSHFVMLRDPWGLPLQLARRGSAF